jgi:hypothetical protein
MKGGIGGTGFTEDNVFMKILYDVAIKRAQQTLLVRKTLYPDAKKRIKGTDEKPGGFQPIRQPPTEYL